MRPESSLNPARVGDLTWGKGRGKGVRVTMWFAVAEYRDSGVRVMELSETGHSLRIIVN